MTGQDFSQWPRFFPMAKFAYNNAKNASNNHTPFELNRGHHSWISYKEEVDPYSKSKLVDELLEILRELRIVCQKNPQHAQELQKRARNKSIKFRNYALNNKIWLNSKCIKIKQNLNLKTTFFGPFRVLHLVGKQVYKLKLPKKWKIYDVFHILLLEQNNTKKARVDKKVR